MAIIAKEIIPPRKEHATVRLNPDVMTQLDAYCRDRGFHEWRRIQGTTGEDA